MSANNLPDDINKHSQL